MAALQQFWDADEGTEGNVSATVKLKSPHNTYMTASEFARKDTDILQPDQRSPQSEISILQTFTPSSTINAVTPTNRSNRSGGGSVAGGSGSRGAKSRTPGSSKKVPGTLQQKRMMFSMVEPAVDAQKVATPRSSMRASPAMGRDAIVDAGGYRFGSGAGSPRTPTSAAKQNRQKNPTLASPTLLPSDGSSGKPRVPADGVREVFKMYQLEDGTVSFLSAFGTWLSAQPEEGSLLCQAPERKDWERFVLLQYRTPRASPHYCLRTCHGTYVSFSTDGAVRHIKQMLSEVCIFELEMLHNPESLHGLRLSCRCQRSSLPLQTARARKALWRSRWRNKRPRVLVVLREHCDQRRAGESSRSHYHHEQRKSYRADPFTFRADCPVEEFLDHFKRFVVDPLHAIGSMVHIFIGCGDRSMSNYYAEGGSSDSGAVGLWDGCREMFGTAVVGYFDPLAEERMQEVILRPTGAPISPPPPPPPPPPPVSSSSSSPPTSPLALPWGRVLELVKQVDASRLIAYDIMLLCRVDIVWQAPIDEWGSDPRHINFLFREPPSSASLPPSEAGSTASAGLSASDACHLVPRSMLPQFISALKSVHRLERQRASSAAAVWGASSSSDGLFDSATAEGMAKGSSSGVGTRDLFREVRRNIGGASVHGTSGGSGGVHVCLDCAPASSSSTPQRPPRQGIDCWPSQEVDIDDKAWVRPNPLYSFGEHRPMCHRGGSGHHVTLVFEKK